MDVGQGDAQFIQLPSGENILIDAGEHSSNIAEKLKSFRVNDLALVVATHPHSDHIGGMREVLRNFQVHEFWDAGYPHTTPAYENMLEEIVARSIDFKTPRRGYIRSFGGVTLEIIHPPEGRDYSDINDSSLVILLSYGENRFLFAGDACEQAWQDIISAGQSSLKANLLKLPHHGSSTGTTRELLDSVKPEIVTISAALGNDYHHPHPKVMRLLKQRADSITIYRTDLQGTITATSDGKNIQVNTERQAASDSLFFTGDEATGTIARDDGLKGGVDTKKSRRNR